MFLVDVTMHLGKSTTFYKNTLSNIFIQLDGAVINKFKFNKFKFNNSRKTKRKLKLNK